MKTGEVALGARIPRELKDRLDRFCREHGLKMSHLVKMALLDKLGDFQEEVKDLNLARARLTDAEFISQEEYNRYLKRRLRTR